MVVLGLGLSACAHNPRLQGRPCETTCGVRLYGSNNCEAFRAAEAKAVNVYDGHLESTCDRLYGWVVYVQPPELASGAWVSPAGRVVRGLAWCRERTIQVATDDWSWSSLAHELLHAAECGERMADEHPHAEWEVGWQADAVKLAR
ncbi:MAG: hypothetical protein ACYC8T_03970 [Myxococcaceae bacterium]